MENEKIEQTIPKRTIEVQISSDNMTGFIKLEKPEEDQPEATKEEMLSALAERGVIYGIREAVIDKLAEHPIYAFRMEVAKGLSQVPGKDGEVVCHVKRDKDYAPEYDEEGTIDYKNIDYFQLAKKGQILCDIAGPEPGADGMDIFGERLMATRGKDPILPLGDNTSVTEDGTQIVADCDGLVRYVGNRIDISEILTIRSSVNNLTGNINFPGDVTISGDVCNGISVKAGGNIIIKGVIEDATVQAAGSLHVMNGINGDGKNTVSSGKGLTCKYIENAIVHVEGNITADYIIDSELFCSGDIVLTGTKEVLIGGSVKLGGELRVRDIGNAHERPTKVEIIGIKAIDERKIAELSRQRDNEISACNSLIESAARLAKHAEAGRLDPVLIEQLVLLKQQIQEHTDRVSEMESEIDLLKKREFIIFPGYITCRRKIYQGVRIYFGEHRFQFNLDNIEHCRIYWYNGEIVQTTL